MLLELLVGLFLVLFLLLELWFLLLLMLVSLLVLSSSFWEFRFIVMFKRVIIPVRLPTQIFFVFLFLVSFYH